MNPEELEMMIAEGEGLRTEFKEKYRKEIDKDMVAFANTKGGKIILGVRDKGEIIGFELDNDMKAKINDLARNCKPSVEIRIEKVSGVVVIDVPEGDDKPYMCKTGYFRRLDGSTQKMTPNEIKSMYRKAEKEPFEERIPERFSVDEISLEKIKKFIDEAKINIKLEEPTNFLESLGVLKDGQIINAGVLMFSHSVGKHIPQARIRLIRFNGTSRVDIMDRSDVSDELLSQFNEAFSFVKKHIMIKSVIKDAKRTDIPEIPLEVIREAIANAIIHRDYSVKGTESAVEIFDDRIEITNPGGLPRQITGKNFGKLSVRRNEILADLFFRLRIVEKAGTGIPRMRELLNRAGLPLPEFEDEGESFRVTIRRPVIFNDSLEIYSQEFEKEISSFPERQRWILRMVMNGHKINLSILRRQFPEVAEITLRRDLVHLKKEGYIIHAGSKKTGWYEKGEKLKKLVEENNEHQ